MNWDDDDRELLKPSDNLNAAVLSGEIVGLRIAMALIWERVMELAPDDWRPWVDQTTLKGLREIDKVDFEALPAKHREIAKQRARQVALMTLTLPAELQMQLDRR
jgi:hypothetical protein